MIDPVPEAQSLDVPPPEPPALPRRNLLYRTFVGPRGVRAGWKVLLFFLIFAGIGFCFRPLLETQGKVDMHAPVPPGFALLNELLTMVDVLLSTWIMARWIDRKPFGYFGMPPRNAFRSAFWTGASVGLVALAVQLEIMHLAGWFDFGTLQLHGADILTYGAFWLAVFLCVGITEEGMLRGYVQRVTTDGLVRLPGGWSFWISALIFSIVFASDHLSNPGENKFGIVMVFVDGFAMCFSLWRTGDLWFAIGNHAAWDWGETFLFGTPDSGFLGQHALLHPSFHGSALLSGGTDGPEGSVLALLSEAIFILSVAVIYRRRKFRLLSEDAISG